VGETNYFHVLNDLIGGRLRLAEEGGVAVQVPLVVSEGLASTRFFRDIRRLPGLQDRTWIIQGRDFIESPTLYFCQTSPLCKESLDYARRLLCVPDSDASATDRLFLTRSAAVGRTPVNLADVQALCERFGFQTVDTAGMGLSEQMELFSNAGYVVGIHGAGLVNIIFRKNAPLRLLEIFNPEQARTSGTPQPHYFFISRAYGFDYRAMVGTSITGTAMTSKSSFAVDTDELAAHLVGLLS